MQATHLSIKLLLNDDEINSKVYERYREQHSDIVEIDEKN